MNNYIKAFLFHLAYVFFIFLFSLWYIQTVPALINYTESTPLTILLITLIIIGYIFLGTLLSTEKDKKNDLFYGIIITLVGIALWIYILCNPGSDIDGIITKSGEDWILFDLFLLPNFIIYFLLNVPTKSPLVLLPLTIFPSILMGIGIKLKRRLKNKNLKANIEIDNS